MNQILVTGDERVVENVKKVEKVKKEKKLLPINGIIMFYAISIIILGICMISGSVYAKEKINQTVEASIRPEITVERNDEDNTLQIAVSHKLRTIKSVTYKWNDEEEITIQGDGKKSITETIDLIGGENTLKIIATEENGQTSTFEKKYKVTKIDLESVTNGVKLTITSGEVIDYMEYTWDDGEMQKIQVGEKIYEGIINTPVGEHILKIEVTNINGVTTTKQQEVIGEVVVEDEEPTVKVEPKLVNGKSTFVIDVEDDESITTLEIVHNGGEKQVINVNAKTYHKEITMTEGEINTLIIRATNINGTQKTRGVKFDNK